MSVSLLTHTLGYPRIGARRELKKAVEDYWRGHLSRAVLDETARALRRDRWLVQKEAGVGLVPSNDFSLYDHVLDTSCLVGNIPPRFGHAAGSPVDADTAFAVARGGAGAGAHAGEMTKWFDTNYHYIVPEFSARTRFYLSGEKPFAEFKEALALGIKTKPLFVGPVTYLSLGKGTEDGFDPLSLLDGLLDVYAEILRKLAALGAEWVQFDEPVAATDLSPAAREALTRAYTRLSAAAPSLKIIVASYFGGLRDNRDVFLRLPVAAVHVDCVRAPEELDAVLRELPAGTALSLGVIDGRGIWRTELGEKLRLVQKALAALGPDRLLLAPSCSLLHVPVSLAGERDLEAAPFRWMAFANEKLAELDALARLALPGRADAASAALLEKNRRLLAARRDDPLLRDPAVRARLAAVTPADLSRKSPHAARRLLQRARLGLPPFPTTTIGSFPQTPEIRAARARFRKGEISAAAYDAFLEEATAVCVRAQEEAGLDMLVHGEFERNDMVEYFGEQLQGFAFTENGWVQSYGTRCVKPPVIYGDVARRAPMTTRWARFAQSLTPRPLKGMLTGPITLLQWSFVRDDQPRAETARQLALALRDEVADLEAAGLAAIQIDEPGLREGLPARREDRPAYLQWAVDAFRLAAAGARDDTQIHTHMCYAEFNDIIADIARMDADVITIEASRSGMEVLRAFEQFRYPNEIGPGVWDIHSPRVPETGEMVARMRAAAAVLPAENLWVNPDCGLKTRGWSETKASLANLVACARILREG
jgi:5-methyltetrahydropteroyltriglutamate--homocysteine methyltransferase